VSFLTRFHFYRGALSLFFVMAALGVGGYSISLLADAVRGSGSFAGNVFSMAFGLLLLVLAPLIFIVGIINWRKALHTDA